MKREDFARMAHQSIESIWKRRRDIESARSQKMQDLMKEYDETVYYPAKRAVIRECFLEGHHGGLIRDDNGLGWSWYNCAKCGGRFDKTGPSGEKHKDDGDWEE